MRGAQRGRVGYRVVLILHNLEKREPRSWAVTYECHVFRKNAIWISYWQEGLFQMLLRMVFGMVTKLGVT